MSNQIRRTKILATLGPATDAPGVLEAVLRAGVNVVRLNFSHGSPEHHAKRIGAVRAIAAQMDREVGVLADFQGPKIRVETFVDDKVELHQGAAFNLVCRADVRGDATQVGMSYLGLVNDVSVGDLLLLDDGLLSLRVDAIDGDVIRTTVQNDGVLSNRKGLNRLGGGLSLGALTEKDRSDIVHAATLDVDFMAISFAVRRPTSTKRARWHDRPGPMRL